MTVIVRGEGVNASEKYLASLADKAFLKLWSYPNLFIDRKQGGKGDGKEFCDLMVVCGDDILIFSVKSVDWPKAKEFSIAWPRWYRHAIEKSAAQIRGAERWLTQHPERIFLDRACTERPPVEFPPADRRRVHGILVALGATEACAAHYQCNDGSFVIAPDLKGADHKDVAAGDFIPFGIGDVEPDSSFVHVFDGNALDLVFRELDTVLDFTRYLTRRAAIIRSGILMPVTGEAELLGVYLVSAKPDRDHGFYKPDGGEWKDGDRLAIAPGTFAGLARHPSYIAKRKADEVSYVWDYEIDLFVKDILSGDAVSAFGDIPKAIDAEQALRSMALGPRVHRRLLGAALTEAMKEAERRRADRFVRVYLPGPDTADRLVAYVFLILAGPPTLEGYDQYRRYRANVLETYCLHTLRNHRDLKRAVGIAMDASPKVTGRVGSSHDLIDLEMDKWTSAEEQRVRELEQKFDVMRAGRVKASHLEADEFPRPATAFLFSRRVGARNGSMRSCSDARESGEDRKPRRESERGNAPGGDLTCVESDSGPLGDAILEIRNHGATWPAPTEHVQSGRLYIRQLAAQSDRSVLGYLPFGP